MTLVSFSKRQRIQIARESILLVFEKLTRCRWVSECVFRRNQLQKITIGPLAGIEPATQIRYQD